MQSPEVNNFPEGYPNSALKSALALLAMTGASPAESGKECCSLGNAIHCRSRAGTYKSQK